MTAEQLRNSILQEAISGRLTQSDTSDWREITIGQLGTVVTGTTPSKQNKEYYGDDYPFYKPSDLDAGIYTVKASDGLSKVGYEHARQLPANSILVTCIGATIGKTGLIKREGSCNQQINAIIPDADCDSRFIYYLMISPDVQEVIKYKSYSTTLPILNKTQFSQLEVTLPPLAEQKRIVAKLEELLPIVEQYGKAQKELDELNAALPARLRQSILQEAIQGKLTEHDLEDNWAKVYCEKLPKLKYKSSPEWPQEYPFELPENWEWCRIGDICELMNGYAFKSTQYKDTGVRVIRITNVQDGYIVDNNPKFYPQIPDIERYALKEGDLLMSLTGNVGRVGILPQSMLPAALNQRVACLRLKDERLKPFLFWYLRCPIFRERCEGSGHGMAQLNISTEWVKQEFFPLPPLAEQQRIVAKIEELFAEIDKMK